METNVHTHSAQVLMHIHKSKYAYMHLLSSQMEENVKSQFVIEFTKKFVIYKFLANYLKFRPNQISMIGFNSSER